MQALVEVLSETATKTQKSIITETAAVVQFARKTHIDITMTNVAELPRCDGNGRRLCLVASCHSKVTPITFSSKVFLKSS